MRLDRIDVLYGFYFNDLCGYVKNIVSSFEVAEDIVQDFFCSFLEGEKKLDGSKNAKSFFYVSCRNKAYSYLRGNQRGVRQVYLPADEIDEINFSSSSLNDIESSYIQGEIMSTFVDVLNSLNEYEKDIWNQYYNHEMPIAEIARKHDCSRYYITRIVNTIKKKMQDTLGEI